MAMKTLITNVKLEKTLGTTSIFVWGDKGLRISSEFSSHTSGKWIYKLRLFQLPIRETQIMLAYIHFFLPKDTGDQSWDAAVIR